MRTAAALLLLFAQEKDVDVIFSPSGDTLRLQTRIAAELRRARTSIDVAMFHFTSDRLARVLAERKRDGLRIRVLLDAGQSEVEFVARLRKDGLDVRLATPRGEGARFHHKFAVLDEGMVITGSYNWTYRADSASHENVVLLSDVRAAREFRVEFERLWNDSGLSRP